MFMAIHSDQSLEVNLISWHLCVWCNPENERVDFVFGYLKSTPGLCGCTIDPNQGRKKEDKETTFSFPDYGGCSMNYLQVLLCSYAQVSASLNPWVGKYTAAKKK